MNEFVLCLMQINIGVYQWQAVTFHPGDAVQIFKLLSFNSNISIKTFFVLKCIHIGFRNEIKLLHSFKEQLKRMIFQKRERIEACQSQVQTSFSRIKIVLA